jgi:uncharacterized protein YjbI with pentapeptide repeats
LLVDKNLLAIAEKEKPKDEERELLASAMDVISARTLSILRRFEHDPERKTSVIRFLIEADFVSKLNLNLSGADLSGADLSGVNLTGVNLRHSNLSHTCLGWADLSAANLSAANLNGANLSGANFLLAELNGTRFNGANLSGADFSGANLYGADLRYADLSGAVLKYANFFLANLGGARCLTAEHLATAKLCNTKLSKEIALNPDRDCEASHDHSGSSQIVELYCEGLLPERTQQSLDAFFGRV